MASSINIPVYSDALVVLATAGVVVPMVHRWGISPVLGYLGAGALLGPLGLGSFIDKVPFLYWFTVVDSKNVAGIADLGVVFLLFLIGLELSYERLLSMRRLVFGLGGLQVLISTVVIAAVLGFVAGRKDTTAVIVGACLASSSTAIVLEVLSRQGRLTTSVGRSSFAILLAQDLAVIPLLMLISIMGADKSGSVASAVGIAFMHAFAALALIVLVGRMMLRPLFRQVAATKSSELFIATILFVIVATGVVAALADMSMALGAFVAGLLLAETEYRKAIEATIEPFKGLLLGIFFFTVGMGIDVRELAREPLWLLASVVALVGVKAAIVIGLCRLFKVAWPAAFECGLLLGPGGEFAFVGIGLAAALGVVPSHVASFALAVVSLTMVAIPLLDILARRIAPMLEAEAEPHPALGVLPVPQKRHAIVIGYGRVGSIVCDLLSEHHIAFTAVDNNADTVHDERGKGREHIYYGDAKKPEFLKVCGLADAAGVIITTSGRNRIDDIVREVRSIRPDVLIVARARDADHAKHLYSLGVTDAVPETIEASLQLSEAALVGLGIPTGLVIASIHEQRDAFRHALQEAATRAGRKRSRSLRSKRKR